ncbi:MAG: Uma2 family endonuclease [Pyrinomonadaceae bacterium MAG19_C2-C3]|nr:Uma2 family endonuclease [Pyrinomonadaceae bacterium MAG19_C2-C3]
MSLPRKKIERLFTVDEYLAFERTSEERHEYLDGAIYQMAGESLAHGRICTNLVRVIGNQLLGKQCDVFSKDMKVKSSELPRPRRATKGLFSYPDIVVVCDTPQFHDQYTDILLNPTAIIEVLSDSTGEFDRGEKFRRYRTHLSLLTDYVLVAQHEPLVEHFTRKSDARWELVSYESVAATLHLATLNLFVELADMYARVEFPPEFNDAPAVVE